MAEMNSCSHPEDARIMTRSESGWGCGLCGANAPLPTPVPGVDPKTCMHSDVSRSLKAGIPDLCNRCNSPVAPFRVRAEAPLAVLVTACEPLRHERLTPRQARELARDLERAADESERLAREARSQDDPAARRPA